MNEIYQVVKSRNAAEAKYFFTLKSGGESLSNLTVWEDFTVPGPRRFQFKFRLPAYTTPFKPIALTVRISQCVHLLNAVRRDKELGPLFFASSSAQSPVNTIIWTMRSCYEDYEPVGLYATTEELEEAQHFPMVKYLQEHGKYSLRSINTYSIEEPGHLAEPVHQFTFEHVNLSALTAAAVVDLLTSPVLDQQPVSFPATMRSSGFNVVKSGDAITSIFTLYVNGAVVSSLDVWQDINDYGPSLYAPGTRRYAFKFRYYDVNTIGMAIGLMTLLLDAVRTDTVIGPLFFAASPVQTIFWTMPAHYPEYPTRIRLYTSREELEPAQQFQMVVFLRALGGYRLVSIVTLEKDVPGNPPELVHEFTFEHTNLTALTGAATAATAALQRTPPAVRSHPAFNWEWEPPTTVVTTPSYPLTTAATTPRYPPSPATPQQLRRSRRKTGAAVVPIVNTGYIVMKEQPVVDNTHVFFIYFEISPTVPLAMLRISEVPKEATTKPGDDEGYEYVDYSFHYLLCRGTDPSLQPVFAPYLLRDGLWRDVGENGLAPKFFSFADQQLPHYVRHIYWYTANRLKLTDKYYDVIGGMQMMLDNLTPEVKLFFEQNRYELTRLDIVLGTCKYTFWFRHEIRAVPRPKLILELPKKHKFEE